MEYGAPAGIAADVIRIPLLGDRPAPCSYHPAVPLDNFIPEKEYNFFWSYHYRNIQEFPTTTPEHNFSQKLG
jgi:hypothetical protein